MATVNDPIVLLGLRVNKSEEDCLLKTSYRTLVSTYPYILSNNAVHVPLSKQKDYG